VAAGIAQAAHGGQLTVRGATKSDVGAIARIFGEAFTEYRQGFGVTAATLGRFWAGSLAARVDATRVAALPDGTIAGFIVTVLPGARERYGDGGEEWNQTRMWLQELGWGMLWRPAALFIPMGLAYARRSAGRDELYVSLVGVDPAHQGRGIGQALLRAADDEARACGAAGILLHTASTNTRALRAYARAGYEIVATVRAPWLGPARVPAYVALRKPIQEAPTPVLDSLDGTRRTIRA
jgi:ribosomal-protein-alanine N-acetyltransferase